MTGYLRDYFTYLFIFIIVLLGANSSLWKEDSVIDPSYHDIYLESYGRTISGGSSQIQRNIIAERILGLPKDFKN